MGRKLRLCHLRNHKHNTMANISKAERERRATILATGETVVSPPAPEDKQAAQDEAQAIKAEADAQAPDKEPEAPVPDAEDESAKAPPGMTRVRYGTEWVNLHPGEPLKDPMLGELTPEWKAWKAKQK